MTVTMEIKVYEKKNNFNPTMRHNAFLDRRVEFEDNDEGDEDNAGGDKDYYGGNYSGNKFRYAITVFK
jgi:hypothetical protein